MNQTYNIYCDESCHLEHDNQHAMGIGAIWCPKTERIRFFKELRELKMQYSLPAHCELKWNAVSPSKKDYYKAVIDYFFSNDDLHFRGLVVVNKELLQHENFNQTHDDFYYKMYFRMLKTIIDPTDNYEIYIDRKDTRSQQKVEKLQEVLSNANYDFDRKIITRIQQVNSSELELLQLADLLIGAVTYLHRGITSSSAKMELIDHIKKKSGYSLTQKTLYMEKKLNLFIWDTSKQGIV